MNKKLKIALGLGALVVAGYFGAQYFKAKQKEEHFAPRFYEITGWPTSVPISKNASLNWTIANLVDHGSELRDKTMPPPRPDSLYGDILERYAKITSESGKYVEVVIRIDNATTEEQSWRGQFYSFQLTDERGRKFRPLAVGEDFVSKPLFKEVPADSGSTIRPGIPREFSMVFEVAKDSTTYTLGLESQERF